MMAGYICTICFVWFAMCGFEGNGNRAVPCEILVDGRPHEPVFESGHRLDELGRERGNLMQQLKRLYINHFESPKPTRIS